MALNDILSQDAPIFEKMGSPLSPVFWLWIPVALYVAIAGSIVVDPGIHKWLVSDEKGLGENLTTLMFFITAIYAFLIFRQRDLFAGHWVRWMFLLTAALGIFVAGEEASWGQHFFGWGTPEWMADLNKQDETNLHNMAERVLDQKPRAIISILIFLGGVVVPLLYKKGKLGIIDQYPMVKWLLPTTQLIPAAVLTFIPRLPDRIQANVDVSLGPFFNMPTHDFQEMQELFIATFIVLYFATLYLRLRAN